jgi:hypothetical protein
VRKDIGAERSATGAAVQKKARLPPLEPRSGGMRGIHEHSRLTVIMGGPDKPGDDEEKRPLAVIGADG